MQTFKLQNVEPVGTVIVKKNTAQRRLGDRVLWDRLARESPVYIWDLIRIADNSAATLYVQDNSIDLGENTLVRIVPSPDGEGIMLMLNQGTVSIAAGENARAVSVEIGRQQLRTEPGTYLIASVNNYGAGSFQRIESREQFVQNISVPEMQGTKLVSPAVNSTIRYRSSLPVLYFHWLEVEEAASYIFEVSASPDFSDPVIRRQTSANFLTDTGLEQGVWYWRVMPVMPSIFLGDSNFTTPSFFSVEAVSAETAQNTSLSQWLETETSSAVAPPGVPDELVPQWIKDQAPAPLPPLAPVPVEVMQPPVRQAQRQEPETVTPFAMPRNLQPANRVTFGHDELQSQKSITFRWAAVQGANSYIFTMYQQTPAGRRQIIRTTINGTSYTLNNLRILDRGTFVWQVEAVSINRSNTITRRGRVAENTFNINIPAPGPVHVEDTGILYGN